MRGRLQVGDEGPATDRRMPRDEIANADADADANNARCHDSDESWWKCLSQRLQIAIIILVSRSGSGASCLPLTSGLP